VGWLVESILGWVLIQRSLSIAYPRFAALSGRKFFLLFLFLLGSLIVYPYAESNAFGYYAFRVLSSFVIVLCVYAVSFRRTIVLIAFLLAIPAAVQHLLDVRASGFLPILNITLSFVFDVLIIVVIFRRVFTPRQPDAETIFGALCIYMLVGFTFASLYGLVAREETRAFYFDPTVNLHIVPNRLDFIYYSFGTLTSLGASGIVPVTAQARSLTVIEAILGVLYLAVLISRLVGAYRHPAG
jgi:hypothetical protein